MMSYFSYSRSSIIALGILICTIQCSLCWKNTINRVVVSRRCNSRNSLHFQPSSQKQRFLLSSRVQQSKRDIDVAKSPVETELKMTTESMNDVTSQSQWLARGILLLVSAFYGTNFGCVKILGAALNPGVASLFRFSIASLVFMPQLIKTAKTNQKLIMGGLEVGLYSAIGYFAQAESLLSTNASNVAFICSLAVIVVPIIESLFGAKKGWPYLKSALLPALLAAAGVGCLELGGNTTPGVGDLWAFLQPLFFGLGFWRIESHMKNCTTPTETQAFTGAMMLVVALFSLVWTVHDFVLPVASYGPELFRLSMQSQFTNILADWHIPLALAWTGIVTTALTSYGENVAMKDLDAAESTVIYSTEPLWGAAFASVTLGEQIGWNTIVGAMLILGACAWRTVGPQLMGMISSSTLLNADGLEEIIENINLNLARIMQQAPPDLPEM